MPSCKSGATSPSSRNTPETEKHVKTLGQLYSEQCGQYTAWTGIGLFCLTPTLEPNCKNEISGWLKDWSLKVMTGIHDEQVKYVLAQLEGTMTKEVKDFVGWAHSKENRGTWSKAGGL